MKPTDEQLHVVDVARSGKAMSIEALAGTGKTTTLTLVAKALPGRGQYIAFNKAIVNDSKGKFSAAVACNTAHSLAFRAVDPRLTGKVGKAPRMTSDALGVWLDAQQFIVAFEHGERRIFDARDVARVARTTVRHFAKSADPEITARHVPYEPLMHDDDGTRAQLVAQVLPHARKIWADLTSFKGDLPFEHDHYLKLWQLDEPKIAADFILFDEAQDADPVMLDVVNRQDGQRLFCGDRFQAIYEWRGAVNALTKVKVDDTAWLTQSFRFGDAIANKARVYLEKLRAPKMIRGNPELRSTVGRGQRADAVLCRTNGGVVTKVLEAQERGRRVAVVGGAQPLIDFAKACEQLMRGQRTAHPELAPFHTWDEVRYWVQEEPDEAGQIGTWVNLIDGMSTKKLIAALEDCVEEKVADLTMSTVHRAKGREWPRVYLAPDFPHIDDMQDEELRLAYVAVTRAQLHLDDTSWDSIMSKAQKEAMAAGVPSRVATTRSKPVVKQVTPSARPISRAPAPQQPAAKLTRSGAGVPKQGAGVVARSSTSKAAAPSLKPQVSSARPNSPSAPPEEPPQISSTKPKRRPWNPFRR
jgi:hypothetical protein